MTDPKVLETLPNQFLLVVFYATDVLCVVHAGRSDEHWDYYDASRKEIREELNKRGLLPEQDSAFDIIWNLARKDLQS